MIGREKEGGGGGGGKGYKRSWKRLTEKEREGTRD